MNIIKGKINEFLAERADKADLEVAQQWRYQFWLLQWSWFNEQSYIRPTHSNLMLDFIGQHLPRVGDVVTATAVGDNEVANEVRIWFDRTCGQLHGVVHQVEHNAWGGGVIAVLLNGVWEREKKGNAHYHPKFDLTDDEFKQAEKIRASAKTLPLF